ncbi:hypothetical protein SCALM49S_05758 [Streptomyces californicus]
MNLEEPRSRWSGGVDSEDHFLDISVNPDRSWRWLDEDEFAEVQRVGLMAAAPPGGYGRPAWRRSRSSPAGGRRSGTAGSTGGWTPESRVPPLPDDWDRTPPMPS